MQGQDRWHLEVCSVLLLECQLSRDHPQVVVGDVGAQRRPQQLPSAEPSHQPLAVRLGLLLTSQAALVESQRLLEDRWESLLSWEQVVLGPWVLSAESALELVLERGYVCRQGSHQHWQDHL